MSVKPPEVSSKRMTADELRDTFIRFFKKRGHQHVNSASVVPRDKTLLFTSAGMVQFKPYFSGEIDPKEHEIAKRATTHQKCVRTTDLDLVGDATHLTFFEMLGNFSFNDYFKEDACKWALELMVDELGFDRDRLLFTIHPSDDEAHAVWRALGVPDERIHRFQDNWWGPVGGEGACGPCSEIHVYMGDMKKLKANNYRMDPDSGEFIELYNLVFPQFYRERDGEDRDLERRNVDTGMGLERVLMVMSQADSPYETELFKPMLELIADAAGKSIDDPRYQKPLRVITEHLRAAFFMLADGVIPDSTKRGAVLRRIIRRGFDATSEIGLKEVPSGEYLKLLADKMGAAYPELKEHRPQLLQALKSEEGNYKSNSGDPTKKIGSTIGFFLKANSDLKSGHYEEAISNYDKVIELDPRNANACHKRGIAKAELGKHEEAISDYDKVIELDPRNANAYHNRGAAKANLVNYKGAISDFTKAIELAPNYMIAYNNRGRAKGELDKHEEAISDYDKATELDPDFADAYCYRGLAKGELGNYKEAVSDFTKAIELDPDYADAYCNRGLTKGELGKHEEAISDYDKAIELDPDFADAYCYRGLAKVELGNYEEAISDFTKAIELDPSYAIAYNNRGLVKSELGKYEEAISDCDKAIELDPDFADAYCYRGLAKVELGNYKGAISDFTKAIGLDPNYMIAYNNRGRAKGDLGKHKEAISDYDKAIELAPDYADAYCYRGLAKRNLGNHEEAISDYDKAIELDPNYADAYNNRGVAKDELGNHEEAISDYDKAIELDPDYADAYNNRGVVKDELGNHEEAISDYDKAIELDPEHASARNNRKVAKARLGNHEEVTDVLSFRTVGTRKGRDYGDSPERLEQIENKSSSKQRSEPTGQQSADRNSEDLSKSLGKMAFRFHDQFGVSMEDFVKALGKDNPLSQKDKDEIKRHYDIELERKRKHDSGKSRFKKDAGRQVFDDLRLAATEFVRDEYTLSSEIKAIVKDGELVEQIDEGAAAMLVLERTPFYAEKGGQIGDTGYVKAEKGGTVLAEVTDTQEGGRGIYVHKVENVRETLKVGMKVRLEIDGERRERIMRNHTGTHLVHAALREVLGHSTRQFGSLVHPDYLRFDFTAPGPVSRENLDKVQAIVNERIRKNQPVEVDNNTTYGQAVKEGALAFFEGKYGEKVRTIKIDEPKTGKTKIGKTPWSYELCGGTHMKSTGGIGAFIITGESGVSNGVRRIFALTGVEAEKAIGRMQELTRNLNMPRFDVGELERKLNTLQKERDDTAERYKRLESRYLKLLSKADGEDGGEEVNYKLEYKGNGSSPLPVQVRVVSQMKLEALRKLGDSMRDKLGSGVVILGSDFEGEATLVVMATKGSASEQVHAGKLVQRLTASMGGSGGGSQLVGQGGGRDASKLASALSKKGVTKALKELNA